MKYIKIFFIFIILVSSLLLFALLAKNCCVFDDDFVFSTYLTNESLFDCLKFSFGHGGGYLGWFLSKFFTQGLPVITGIHPCDFAGLPHALIKGSFLCCILLITAYFSKAENKQNTLFILSLVLASLYFFFSAFSAHSFIFEVSYNFYRYVFSFLFSAPFLYFLYKCFTSKNYSPALVFLITASICAWVTGTSSEISFYMFAAFIGTGILYSSVLYLAEKLFKRDFSAYKFYFNKNLVIPVICFFTALIMFTGSEGYANVASQRTGESITDFIPVFNALYLKYCFSDNLLYWITFVFCLITAVIAGIEKKEYNKIIFNIFITASLLTVMYSLVVCGSSFYGNSYISNSQVILIFKLWLIYPLLLLFSYIACNKYLKYCVYFCITVSLLFIGNGIKKEYAEYKDALPSSFAVKREFYMIDKIARFYYLKNEPPFLPSNAQYFFFGSEGLKEKTYIPDDRYSLAWYPKTYSDNISIEKGFFVVDDAYERFHKNGGTFNDFELKNIKFSRLYDKNFVLNNQPKLSD